MDFWTEHPARAVRLAVALPPVEAAQPVQTGLFEANIVSLAVVGWWAVAVQGDLRSSADAIETAFRSN